MNRILKTSHKRFNRKFEECRYNRGHTAAILMKSFACNFLTAKSEQPTMNANFQVQKQLFRATHSTKKVTYTVKEKR